MATRPDFRVSSSISQATLDSIVTSVTKVFKTETSNALKRLQRELKSNTDLQKKLNTMHQGLAFEASQISLAAYQGNFDDRSYRSEDSGNNRRHPGALGQAIRLGYIFDASKDGSLNAVNLLKLDQFAPHWRRLNYGAGAAGRASKNVNVRPMRFGRGVGRKSPGFKFALQDTRPSASFVLPSGLWSASRVPKTPRRATDLLPSRGIGDAFYPGIGSGRPIRTKGIQGVGYIEAGLDFINKEYPKRLTQLALDDMRADLRKSGAK